MTDTFFDSRHELRQRALQALYAMEFAQEMTSATHFAYFFDKEKDDTVDLPLFLINLVKGVKDYQDEIDSLLADKLKKGWTLSRLTLVDKLILRLGLFELHFYDDTPERVAIDEAIELSKEFSDLASRKLINGLLSQYIKKES